MPVIRLRDGNKGFRVNQPHNAPNRIHEIYFAPLTISHFLSTGMDGQSFQGKYNALVFMVGLQKHRFQAGYEVEIKLLNCFFWSER